MIQALSHEGDVVADAEPVSAFLFANDISWVNDETDGEGEHDVDEYPDLRRGRGVVIDNSMWMISTVDLNLDEVILVKPNSGLSVVSLAVTLEEAREALI